MIVDPVDHLTAVEDVMIEMVAAVLIDHQDLAADDLTEAMIVVPIDHQNAVEDDLSAMTDPRKKILETTTISDKIATVFPAKDENASFRF